MRKVLKLLAVGCLLFSMCGAPVSADDEPRQYDARFWLKAASEQHYTDRIRLTSFEGQCRWQSEWMPHPSTNTCITYTQWGSINQNGLSLTFSNHKPLELGTGQQLLASPDSRRLYISQEMGNGFMKVGYIEDPTEDIVFNTDTSKYQLKDGISFQFLPTLYKNVAFSNNSYYIVGETIDGTLVRTALTDLSTKKFVGKSPVFSVSDTKYWAVSVHGTLVVGSNDDNEVIAYELGYCDDRGNITDECATKQIGQSQEMIAESSGIYINDEVSHINLYSRLFGREMSRVSYNFDAESLNRHVTYIALGDSFSSGEGAWNYDNNTDGDNGFSREKCHQSYDAYPQQYAWKHTHWSDEYYEPNLEGDMVMRSNDFTNATCSGAMTKHIQQFKSKYHADEESAKDYPGQFFQVNDLSREDKGMFHHSAVNNKNPGRALQIEFLRKYKPTIATVGIGGNDIGFADTLKACIVNPGTCSAASTNKHIQGKKIQDEFWMLSALFSELHSASPNTRLYAVGYPQFIANNDYECGVNVLLDAYEREFVKQGTRYLNDVIEAAAKKNGLIYVDFEDAIGSAGLCGDGTWAVNGLSLGNDQGPTIRGKTIYFIANESYHPSYLGQRMMADKLIEQYGALDIYPNPNCPQVQGGYCRNDSVRPPAVPKYFGDWIPSATVIYKSGIETAQRWLPLSLSQFKPGAIIKLKAFSQETDLGEHHADANGNLTKNILLPNYLEPGYHTLYASGLDDNGEELIYEQLFLYLPDDTQLGPCSFMPYSNLDQDSDGIDDACDPEITVENPMKLADPTSVLAYPNPERPRPAIPVTSQPATYTPHGSVLGQTTQSNGIVTMPEAAETFASTTQPLLQNIDSNSAALKSANMSYKKNQPAIQAEENRAAILIPVIITIASLVIAFTLAPLVLKRFM